MITVHNSPKAIEQSTLHSSASPRSCSKHDGGIEHLIAEPDIPVVALAMSDMGHRGSLAKYMHEHSCERFHLLGDGASHTRLYT
jgi:hypothetical protein